MLRYDGTTGQFMDVFVPADLLWLDAPRGLAFGPDGNLYVASLNTDDVLRYDGATGAILGAFVKAGSGGLDGPVGLLFGPDRNGDGVQDLYVGSSATDAVLVYNGATGAFIAAFVTPGSGGLNEPQILPLGPMEIFTSASTSSQRSAAVRRHDRRLCRGLCAGGRRDARPAHGIDLRSRRQSVR